MNRPSADELCKRLAELKEEERCRESMKQGTNQPGIPRMQYEMEMKERENKAYREQLQEKERLIQEKEREIQAYNIELKVKEQTIQDSHIEMTRLKRLLEEREKLIDEGCVKIQRLQQADENQRLQIEISRQELARKDSIIEGYANQTSAQPVSQLSPALDLNSLTAVQQQQQQQLLLHQSPTLPSQNLFATGQSLFGNSSSPTFQGGQSTGASAGGVVGTLLESGAQQQGPSSMFGSLDELKWSPLEGGRNIVFFTGNTISNTPYSYKIAKGKKKSDLAR